MEKNNILKYSIQNDFLRIEVLNLGAILRKIEVKTKDNIFKNVVVSYENLKNYIENPAYIGAIIGRTAGRIKNSLLELPNETFKINSNNGKNSLHGGSNSISHRFWNIEIKNKNTISCTINSPHLDNGYPGNLKIQVDYILRENELEIRYFAETDRETYVNLTNHSYFNLSSDLSSTIYDDELLINSDYILKIDKDFIPYEILNLNNSIFNFKDRKKLRNFFEADDEQKQIANNGIDHPFILKKDGVKEIEIFNEKTGIKMEVKTSFPAVVIYTANYFNDINLKNHSAICFETQELPNLYSNKKLNIKPTFINKNKNYENSTRFIFSTY